MRQFTALAEMGVGIAVLFFSQVNRLPQYRTHFAIPDTIPLLADEGRAVYQAYGMRVGSLRQVYAPQVLKKYATLIRGGWQLRLKTDEDTRQLGGDVIVGADGRVVFALCSKNQADRPTPEAMVAALRSEEEQSQ